MRRFRVRDLLISPVAAGQLLDVPPCATGPLTDFDCYTGDPKVPKTKFPCRTDVDPNTSKVCAANSDTTVDCADDTYLPCMQSDKTTPHCYDPKKTKFRCLYDPNPKKDTKGVCKGGTDTKVPGWGDDPWHGCYRNPNSRSPCSDESNSAFPCYTKSNTVRSCRIDAPKGSETDIPCYRNRIPQTYTPCFEPSRFPCSEKDATESVCPPGVDTNCRIGNELTYCYGGENKKTCIKGDANSHKFLGAYAEAGRGLFVDAAAACTEDSATSMPCFTCSETRKPCDLQTSGPGVLGCPPLSALDLPLNNPLAADALAVLHADLRDALGFVQDRQRELRISLAPRSVAEAEELESALQDALTELREVKEELARGGPRRQKTNGQGKKPRRK